MAETIPEKVRKIEEHVNETLRSDLKKTLDAGDKLFAEISDYLQLLTNSLKTMVDIGCGMYVKGVIPSLEPLFVDIGLGFYLECNHSEALQIIESRISFLNDRTAVFKKRANQIRARIKLFLEGLREIQGLTSTQEYRDVL
ncbi:unnamed protein product [Dicrocoelium dendriticum]|nr:unnamed protein product [Dicrocoelium dendriticum]